MVISRTIGAYSQRKFVASLAWAARGVRLAGCFLFSPPDSPAI